MDRIQSSQHPGETVRRHGQLVSIQYLRGFAALSVLLTHVLQWPLPDINFGLLKTGRLGVEVFFVISGFIITTIGGAGTLNPGDFLARRALRIVPAYWAATLLVAALAIAAPSQFRTTVPTVEGLLKSLLFIPSADPKAPLLVLGWTLDYEAFFYAVFASLFFLSSTARTAALCGLFAVLVGVGQSLGHPTHVQAFYTSTSLIGFCFGALLAEAFRHGLITGGAVSRRIALVIVPILVGAYYLVSWDGADRLPMPGYVVMPLAALAIVFGGLQIEAAGRLPHSDALRYLGDASYSLYLFHLFAVAAVWAVARRLFDVEKPLAYLICAAVAIVAGIAFGLVCHHLVERPFLGAGRRWRRAPVPA
jgi:exopolysaccharide production protein ExoZ